MITIAVSGGFDGLHQGHIEYIKESIKIANNICEKNKVLCFLGTDEWLISKKGFFMIPYQDRREIIESIFPNVRCVPVFNTHEALEQYKPNVFTKGGGYNTENLPIEEINICQSYGIEIIFDVGGKHKAYSSRRMIKNIIHAWMKGKIPLSYWEGSG